MALRRRGEGSVEELLKKGEYALTDRLVYVAQQSNGGKSGVIAAHRQIKLDLDLIVFSDLFQGGGVDTVQYVAVITHPIGAHEPIASSIETAQLVADYGCGAVYREWSQDNLMLVGPTELIECRQVVAPLTAAVWLYRFDDFFRLVGKVIDGTSARFVETLCRWIGVSVDRKRCLATWPSFLEKGQLPREVVQARSEIVDDVAGYYADTHGRRRDHLHAVDVVSMLGVYLTGDGIPFKLKKPRHLNIKLVKVLHCAPEFFSWPFKGMRHGAAS